ncbi:cupin-like domain-containing protein [Hyphococcus luteus]|nr:cupin-like domain-containing protein [Marinicaulis flavus]
MSAFNPRSLDDFAERYPASPATLQHRLAGHPLFAMHRLTTLARALPADRIEYNSGDLPIGQDPGETPMNGLSAEETLRRIAENKSWMVLKNIERDPYYARLLNACLDELAPVTAQTTGAMHKREGFIFISSPGSVTPFHMDPEHNILMQIRGAKTFRIFPAARDFVSDEQHEAFHRAGGHRNLPYKEDFDDCATAYKLFPGDALYAPVKAPHWVRVGPDVSISLSITWRSEASDAEASLRRANGWLRAHGIAPPAPGAVPLHDRLASLGARAAARLAR